MTSHLKKLTVGSAFVLASPLLLACSGSNLPSEGTNGTGTTNGVGTSADSDGMTGIDTGGETGGTGQTTGNSDEPPPPYEPHEGMLRRLTRPQFVNAMRDIFNAEIEPSELDADNYSGHFAVVGASEVETSPRGVEQYSAAVESSVDAIFSNPTASAEFVGCTPADLSDSCVSEFVQSLGRRAWRRPLEPDEVNQILAVAEVASTELESVNEGLRWATVALFSSPYFIYRPELGSPAADGSLRINGFEMASRLAFLIWNSLPDDALLDEAAAGMLDTPQGVQAAAARLLSESPGRASIGAFAEDYLRLDRVLTQAKDSNLYPEYNEALQKGMIQDMRQTWELVTIDEDQSAMSLFSTNKVVANAELAELYGLDPTGLDSNTFKEFTLPDDHPRKGILAKSGFLSQYANQQEGSPTLRGKFIREAIMCTLVPAPPNGVALDLVESTEDMPMTKRQRMEAHATNPVCSSCHGFMDPMGLPFESFDAIGKYRTTDSGLPIDPSGELDGTPVANPAELGQVMSENETVAECLVRRYYSYAVGHEDRDVDELVIRALNQSFHDSGFRLKQLILDLVATEAFAAVAPQID